MSEIQQTDSGIWSASITSELVQVQTVLENTTASDVNTIRSVSDNIIKAGGKRIRPALVILSYYTAGGQCANAEAIDLAAAAELIHTASLVHDDVVDEARERRGHPTANSQWGSKMSVLSGDHLLAQAFSLFVKSGKLKVIGVIARVASQMSENQVLETECLGSIDAWKENYWRIIEGKTAVFMQACCECGAIAAEAEDAVQKMLAEYGLRIGLAFQISDDILDITGRQSTVGKDLGADIIAGKYTLPVLEAIKTDSDLYDLLYNGIENEQLPGVIERITAAGGVDRARAEAVSQVNRAIEAIADLPDIKYHQDLVKLAEYIVARRH